MKKIWCKNFEVRQSDYQLFGEVAASFYKFQKYTVGKNYIQEDLFVFENGDNIAAYFLKNELRGLIDASVKIFLNNPNKIKEVHKKTIAYNKQLFRECKKIERYKLQKFSEIKLLRLYKKLFKLIQMAHGYSLPTTWFIDSDGEDLSNYLLKFVKKKIKENKLKISAPEAFSILTTPYDESYNQKEERDVYKILSLILKNKQAKKLFLSQNAKIIEKGIKTLNSNLSSKIFTHYKNYCWMPYTYIGPVYKLDYYLGIWSSLVRQKINPDQEIKKMEETKKETKKKRVALIKDLKLNIHEKNIFDRAAEIVWLKGFRKDVSFYGYYINDKILKELGRRIGLSLMQMKYISPTEIDDYKKFRADELNERKKFSLIYGQDGKLKILTGKKAKEFLKKQKIEKIKIKLSSEIKGTPAFVGKANGRVKIINIPEEMNKMEKGDIMVSHTTFPSLVPAMKKAAAIITDDGGITCHAAIVAREFKTPCIVGTKIATQVLKDGDLVEVDAERGIVKKIK